MRDLTAVIKSKLVRLPVFVLVFTAVFLFSAGASEEKQYIVYPKMQTFSLEEDSSAYGGFIVVGEDELAEYLAADAIEWYEEDAEGVFSGDEVLYWYTNEGALIRIKASAAWNADCYGQGIKVGVIDSGVYEHAEFENRVLDGYNYVAGDTDTSDTLGHGTQVTGLIASANDGVGIDSVAPKVQIVPLKVDNADGNPNVSAVSKAIYGAVNEFDCDVINLSLGFSSDYQTLKDAIDYAVNNGVTVVAAAGNYDVDETNSTDKNIVYTEDDSFHYPAAYDNVIGVGSVDWYDKTISPFSRQNDSVFVTAPGDYVATTLNDGGYSHGYYGTSLAAPLVTATVAVLKNIDSDLTVAEIMDIIAESADDEGTVGYDTAYGHGILDVEAAMKLVGDNRYLANTKVSYMVCAEDSLLDSAVKVADYKNGNVGSYDMNTSFTATASPEYTDSEGNTYTFAYWANGNGTHVSSDSTYTFIAKSNFTLKAVYDKVDDENTEKMVEFWNGNGILLSTLTAENGRINVEQIPDAQLTGYEFDVWMNEDKTEFDVNAELEKALTRVVAQFKDIENQEYTATFSDTVNSKASGKYSTVVEYTAADADDFDYWKLGDEIVSYNPTIKFELWDTVTLTAVYDDDIAEAVPQVTLDTRDDGAHFIIYCLPEGYTPIDAGIVFGEAGSEPRIGSFESKASVKKAASFGQFTAQPGEALHTVARGYLIYEDTEGTYRVVYSN